MYYNKELFVNEEIKANYSRLNKLQTILLLSVSLSFSLVAVAVIITLRVKFSDTFMTGYAMAIIASVLIALVFSLAFPFRKKLDSLRNKQTEELKGQQIYEKYTELLKLGRELNKTNDRITIVTVAISIIAVWVLAVIFPYSFYTLWAFIFPTCICNFILLIRRTKIEKIKTLEAEILHNENENQNSVAINDN